MTPITEILVTGKQTAGGHLEYRIRNYRHNGNSERRSPGLKPQVNSFYLPREPVSTRKSRVLSTSKLILAPFCSKISARNRTGNARTAPEYVNHTNNIEQGELAIVDQ
jgi:hypothetical protein